MLACKSVLFLLLHLQQTHIFFLILLYSSIYIYFLLIPCTFAKIAITLSTDNLIFNKLVSKNSFVIQQKQVGKKLKLFVYLLSWEYTSELGREKCGAFMTEMQTKN